MSEKKEQVLQAINSLPPLAIAGDSRVGKKFVALYNQLHGTQMGQTIYETEKFHFNKLLQENQDLQKCTPISLYGVFLDIAVQRLSIDPKQKLCYIIPNNHNVGTKDNPKWEKRAELSIDGRGELLMRQRDKQIYWSGLPVVVYEHDTFQSGLKDGKEWVYEYQQFIPKPGETRGEVIASFIAFEKRQGEREFRVYLRERIDEFRARSKKPDGPAWRDNFHGMVENKTIKHTFKNMPRIKLMGSFSALETEREDVETVEVDYSLEEEDFTPPATLDAPAQNEPPADMI